jgi:cysteine/O-acetylserine efflux protein
VHVFGLVGLLVMDGVALLELLAIIGIGLLIPGPNGLTCFAHSGLFGKRSNITLISGMAVGFLTVELSVGLLVDSLNESRGALVTLHWIGMIFLLLMAIAMFKTNPSKFKASEIESALGFKTGVLMQFVNGKEWAFVIIIMTQFIEPLGSGLVGIATIMLVTLVTCTTAMILWTILGDKLTETFSDDSRGKLIMKICGSLLGLLWVVFLIQGPQFS